MGDKDIAYLKEFRRREIIVAAEVKEECSFLPSDLNIEPRVAEGVIDKT